MSLRSLFGLLFLCKTLLLLINLTDFVCESQAQCIKGAKMYNCYRCFFCEKIYRKIKNLRKHIQSVHKKDARKHGDGDKIIRLYKVLLLYFKNDDLTSVI